MYLPQYSEIMQWVLPSSPPGCDHLPALPKKSENNESKLKKKTDHNNDK